MVPIASFSTQVTVMNRRMSMLNVKEIRQSSGWIRYDCKIAAGIYSRNEINRIQRLIEENQKMLLEKWNDYFSD
jgi:hypothetical protein